MTEERKIRKPLMEKKRRARINESLEVLKDILLECDPDTASRNGPKNAKLEKADILEMTVNYLQKLRAREKQYNILYPYGAVPNTAMLHHKAKPYPSQLYMPTHNQLMYHRQSLMKSVQPPNNQIPTYLNKNYQVRPVPHKTLPAMDLRNQYKYVPHVQMVSPPTSPEVCCDKVSSSRHEEVDVEGDVWRPW